MRCQMLGPSAAGTVCTSVDRARSRKLKHSSALGLEVLVLIRQCISRAVLSPKFGQSARAAEV